VRIGGRAVGIAALVAAIAIALLLRGTPAGDSPEHRTDSDAANGASALPQLARELGHPTTTLDASFAPDLGLGVLFVLNPTVAFTQGEAQRAVDYVAGGGTLVYASDTGDSRLDQRLRVLRLRALAEGEHGDRGPLLAGVGEVSGALAVAPFAVRPEQVPLLRGSAGQPVAYEELLGRGRVVVLGDPLPLCNGYLRRSDNGRLAADLVSLAPPGTAVAFDEHHHLAVEQGSPLTAWLSTAWGAAVAWAVVAIFLGLLLRGRAFGPRLLPPGAGQRSAAEHVAAVGGLLQRSRSGGLTGRLLAAATRRALAARHGLVAGPDLDRALSARAPAAAAELAAAEAALGRGGREADLLAAVRRLHDLAYPR
jgi:hypothetical protein